jgi:hypothetical protein
MMPRRTSNARTKATATAQVSSEKPFDAGACALALVFGNVRTSHVAKDYPLSNNQPL